MELFNGIKLISGEGLGIWILASGIICGGMFIINKIFFRTKNKRLKKKI
jgi:hypothetical protein